MTAVADHSRDSPTLSIPWGDSGGDLPIAWPEAWPGPDVARPDLSGILDDYPAELNKAIESPIEGPRIEDRIGPGSKVAIVVGDENTESSAHSIGDTACRLADGRIGATCESAGSTISTAS